MSMPAPYVSPVMQVEPAWLDYNGHMNMAYYTVLFDRGGEGAFELMGLGANYASTRRLTTYTAEIHLCYVRELHAGDAVTVTLQLLDADEKRFHFYQEIIHSEGWVAATCETLGLHVDMAGPKVAPMPEDIAANVHSCLAAQAGLPRPARAGRSIGIKRKAG